MHRSSLIVCGSSAILTHPTLTDTLGKDLVRIAFLHSYIVNKPNPKQTGTGRNEGSSWCLTVYSILNELKTEKI